MSWLARIAAVSPAELDGAIADWLRREPRPLLRRLTWAGPAALDRAVAISYGGDVPEIVRQAQRERPARELIDAWAALLGRLAAAQPRRYLELIEAGRVTLSGSPILELVILGSIDLPAAAAIIRPYATSADWLVRYHAVRGLARRTDPESAGVLRAALTDPEQMIRTEAAAALRPRGPAGEAVTPPGAGSG